MHNINNKEPVQIAVVVFVILGVIATVKFVKDHKDLWAYIIPPLTWLAHILIFYACVFLREHIGLLTGIDYTLWSAIIRLQAAILIAGVMGMLAYERLIFRT